MGRAAKRKKEKSKTKKYSDKQRKIQWSQEQIYYKPIEPINKPTTNWLELKEEQELHKAVEDYFSDPELFSWVDDLWKGQTFILDGAKIDAIIFLGLLQQEVLSPSGFDEDHTLAVFSNSKQITAGGINMETGVVWVNSEFPGDPLNKKSGVIILSRVFPDWKKSLFDFLPNKNVA